MNPFSTVPLLVSTGPSPRQELTHICHPEILPVLLVSLPEILLVTLPVLGSYLMCPLQYRCKDLSKQLCSVFHLYARSSLADYKSLILPSPQHYKILRKDDKKCNLLFLFVFAKYNLDSMLFSNATLIIYKGIMLHFEVKIFTLRRSLLMSINAYVNICMCNYS